MWHGGMSGQSNFMQKDKRTINHSNQPLLLLLGRSFSVWILVTVDDFRGNVTFRNFSDPEFGWLYFLKECVPGVFTSSAESQKVFPGEKCLECVLRGKL